MRPVACSRCDSIFDALEAAVDGAAVAARAVIKRLANEHIKYTFFCSIQVKMRLKVRVLYLDPIIITLQKNIY